MKNRSLPATSSACTPGADTSGTSPSGNRPAGQAPQVRHALLGLLIAFVTISLTACGNNYYKSPSYTYAGRPVGPSGLAQRVMVSVTANGNSGSLSILDGLRNIRSNIENTVPYFTISGYSSGYPNNIINFPSENAGYVYSSSDGGLNRISYGTESSTGSAGSFQPGGSSLAIPPTFTHIYGAEESAGVLEVIDNLTGRTYALNLPNVFRVAANTGDTVALAMVRNSNTLYRVVKINPNAPSPPGAVDCQPLIVPVYCVVPVPGTYDQPSAAIFSLDGTTAYILNCGAECGGKTSSVTLMQQAGLRIDNIPASLPYPSPQTANVPVPGGVTVALSDGSTLYLAGQQLQPDGLFAGFLSTMSLASNTITGKYSISDGNHSKLLFADDNTLWIGSQFCATGEHAKLGQNYNCLTRAVLGGATITTQILPAVTPGSPSAVVPYPNGNNDQYYYGSLTGLCWVQNYHKVYTAYGGQVHAFNTVDGSEIDNQFITVQGTALDVAYMDALTDNAD